MCYPELENAEVPSFLGIFYSILQNVLHLRMALKGNALTFFSLLNTTAIIFKISLLSIALTSPLLKFLFNTFQ